MSLLLYNLFLSIYSVSIRIASLSNKKAKQWINGRKSFPGISFEEKTIWMHCASLGEFEQGRPVLEEIKKNHRGYKIVLSFFSPSGFEIRKNYEGADAVIYLPADNKNNAKRLIKSINPCLVFWVKYEYWYHYLTELKNQNIPVILISGIFRKSQPFFNWYGGIWKKMLGCFQQLFVQNKESKELLKRIGFVDNVEIAGDTRFDRVIEIAEKKDSVKYILEFINNKKTLVAGSTWEDDEVELIHYVKQHPEIKVIIAPHEIDRENLDDVKKEFKGSVFYSSLSDSSVSPENIQVLIIDNIGMLSKLYQYADITYVGGGFGNDGIHNVLEAAVYGKPVIFGPVHEKFAEANGLVECGGAFSITNALELETLLDKLFNDKSALMQSSKAARDYIFSNRGATKKIIRYVIEKRLLTN